MLSFLLTACVGGVGVNFLAGDDSTLASNFLLALHLRVVRGNRHEQHDIQVNAETCSWDPCPALLCERTVLKACGTEVTMAMPFKKGTKGLHHYTHLMILVWYTA